MNRCTKSWCKHGLLLALLWLIGSTASACFPVPLTMTQRTEMAEKIWEAYVTGIRLSQFETQIQQANKETQQPEKYWVRISVVQQLKGKPTQQKIVEFELDSCGGGSAHLRDHVLVFFTDGFWYVASYRDDAYQAIISSLKPSGK